MTRLEMGRAEEKVIQAIKRTAQENPRAAQPDVEFKRDWAYGNAGLENETITRTQVNKIIQK